MHLPVLVSVVPIVDVVVDTGFAVIVDIVLAKIEFT